MTNKGKKSKGKKKGQTNKKAAQRVNQGQSKKAQATEADAAQLDENSKSKNTTKDSNVSAKANLSQDLNCDICRETNETEMWFVQCDNCDNYFHFECVGITSIKEEDPWSCPGCIQNIENSAVKDSDVSSSDQTKPINASKDTVDANLKCSVCEKTSDEDRRLVRCDICDLLFHFECVGVTELRELEFWSCNDCATRKKETGSLQPVDTNESVHQQSNDNDISQQLPNRSKSSIQATHNTDNHKSTSQLPFPKIHEDATILLAKGSASQKTDSTRSNVRTKSCPTITTKSSQRLERIQAELALQEKIDQETVLAIQNRMAAEAAIRLEMLESKALFEKEKEALNLKELKLKEKREKRFLEEQAKSRSSQGGSIRTRSSDKTNRSSYVQSWIADLPKLSDPMPEGDTASKKDESTETKTNKVKGDTDKVTSKELDDSKRPFTTKIDEFNFEWSLSLNQEEEKQLTHLLRKSVKDPEANAGRKTFNEPPEGVANKLNFKDFMSSTNTCAQNHPVSISEPIYLPPPISTTTQKTAYNFSKDFMSSTNTSAQSHPVSISEPIYLPPSTSTTTQKTAYNFSKDFTSSINISSKSHPVSVIEPIYSRPLMSSKTDSNYVGINIKEPTYNTRRWNSQIQSTQLPRSYHSGVTFAEDTDSHQRTLKDQDEFTYNWRTQTQYVPAPQPSSGENSFGQSYTRISTQPTKVVQSSTYELPQSTSSGITISQSRSTPFVSNYSSSDPWDNYTSQNYTTDINEKAKYPNYYSRNSTHPDNEAPPNCYELPQSISSGTTTSQSRSTPFVSNYNSSDRWDNFTRHNYMSDINQRANSQFIENSVSNGHQTCASSDVNQRFTDSIVQTPSLGAINSRSLPGRLTAEQIAARQVMGRSPLPVFTGNPSEWERFINKYISSTTNCGLTNVENLERLEKAIQGKARDIVDTLLNLPQCVPEIIETLRQKYGRPEIIIKYVLAKIRSEPVIKADKLEALSNYGYKVRNLRNTIESLKMDYHLYNPELIQELVDKLPHQTKIDWAKHSENMPQISLMQLSDWLYHLAISLNRITMPEISTTSPEKKPERRSEDSRVKAAGYVNFHENKRVNQVKDEQRSKVKKCPVCTNDCKFVGDCSKFNALVVDDKWAAVINNKLCRRCLRKHGGLCRLSKECGVNGCTAKHHSSLHNENRIQKVKPSSNNQLKANDAKPPVTNKVVTGSSNTHYTDDPDTLFRIVPVEVFNNEKSFQTFAFLDEGSSYTMVERHVAKEINLRGTPETICLLWTNNINRVEQSERANIEISAVNLEAPIRYPMRSINIVEDLELPTQTLNMAETIQRFPHLQNLPLIEYKDAKPTIIIGLKHARLITPLRTKEGKEDGPIATRCRLGWSIHGPIDNTNIGYVNAHRAAQCTCQDRDDDLHDMIKDHFTIENFGVTVSSMSLESKENELALEMLKRYTVRIGLRFETRLLWKDNECELPDSYPMAMKRLSCLENKGQQVISVVDEFIKDYIEKGYVSKLSPDEVAKTNSRTWYLPVFTVTNPKKPEKLRPVFDGAARVKGTSLNSVLFTGPDQLVSIVDVLRRFREHKIAICGDIKEMFHQVTIHEEDRNSQRFLWRNGEKHRDPDVYVMNVMTFGATCSPSAAQYVKNLNASEFQQEYPRAAEAIIKNHYVDDLMDGTETVEDGIQLVNNVKFVHSQGGFEIRNFKSNSTDLLKAIGEPINFEKVSVENESMIERVLGMFWDTGLDCFTFSLRHTKVSPEILSGQKLPTKREALRLLMYIYDPLGMLSYYLIHLKILIQDVWRARANWDDQISENLRGKWIRWIEILPNVTMLKNPRCYATNLSKNIPRKVEMHVFVDAGEEAFAAVAYLKIESEEGCQCSFTGSKARVAPLKHLSIPRKELQAAVLGTRLLISITNSQTFKIDRRIIWSDSETVLSWLNSNSRKYSQFVAHRVGEVLENTNVQEWRWIPSKENIADEATKWSKTPTFDSSNRWFKGPEFICLSEDQWPKKKIIQSDVMEEMKVQFAHAKFMIPQCINPERFSKFNGMVRALAYAKRMVNFKTLTTRIKESPLTQEEIIDAENLIFRQAQFEGYPSEMVTLERNKTLPTDKMKFIEKPSPLYDGSPYLDGKGVLRMKWRTDGAREVSYHTRRPIVLPNKGRITMLLIHSYHVKYFHQNHETVFNEIRQKFYIPRLRAAIKRVRSACQMCKVKKAKIMEPQMADLPPARLAVRFNAFSFVGIDYFGPMSVSIGRRIEKRWGVLFTCLTIRAIHIEVASSLNTNECILCIRNFITLHGTPIEIHSDQGSNLKGADNALQLERKKVDDAKLSAEFTNSYTKWIFTAPTAAHMGGSWERLIRSVKSGLYEILPTRTPTESMLRNLLLETANVVNSRPLTYIPLESNEDEALTPNHFLKGSSHGYKAPCKLELDGPYLRESWKESQRLTELFWKRFIREYLPTITRRTKWFKPLKPLQPGDLVLIVDPENPRNTYPKVRILETRMGSNGQVRRAKVDKILEVKTNSKGQICEVRRNALWRPAHKLALLDVSPPMVENSSIQLDGDITPRKETEAIQPEVVAPMYESGLAQPNVDRKTGGSVGANDLNSDSVGQLVQSSRRLRSSDRK